MAIEETDTDNKIQDLDLEIVDKDKKLKAAIKINIQQSIYIKKS